MQDLDRVFGDGVRESADGFVQRGGEWLDGQTLESLYQCVSETVKPVSVADNALAFDVVQNLTNLLGRVLMMIQKRNEIRDGALEVDVVFPERVIGVDEQRLWTIRILA